MGDLETALALAARRQGRRRMPASEWAFTLSLALGWMPPQAARAFVERAAAAAVLVPADGELELAVDWPTDVPVGWRPDPAAGPAVQDPFLTWLDRLAAARRMPREQALQEVAALQTRLGGFLRADVAVLWLAREAGLDVRAAARALTP